MISSSSIASILKNAVFPRGKIVTIRSGELAGFRYTVSDNSGWSPIFGRWEPGAHLLYARAVLQGHVVYDLGANVGLHSMLFSKLVGSAGHVYAFEPVEANFSEIKANISLNRLDNVTVVEKAVSAISGMATFSLGLHNKQGSLGLKTGSTGSMRVVVTSIDDFARTARPPQFLKVDIEGAEGPALRGAMETLKQHQPILSVELHSPDQDVLVGAILDSLDYRLFRFDPAVRTLLRLSPVSSPKLGWPNPSGTWGTILALPGSRPSLLSELKLEVEHARTESA